MENNKILSVIIVNYKSERYLERCLSSLYGAIKGKISSEVIIVNNYPAETLEKIRSVFPEIKVIVNSKNGGFGQGNNVGAKTALGKYLLFLNPDTEIISGSPAEIISNLENKPDIGAIGGQLITEDGRIQEWSAGIEVTLWDLIKNNLGIISSRRIWESQKEIEAAWVAGTALFISRDLFWKTGGFDENIFMYFEDVDLCVQIRAAGKKVIYSPSLKILHKCGGSYAEKNDRQQKQHYYDSLVYYFKKHRPKTEAFAVSAIRKIFF